MMPPAAAAAFSPSFAARAHPLLTTFRALYSTSRSTPPILSIRHFAPKTKRIKTHKSHVAPPGTPPPKNIAVVGGGLAGLAVTYHLLNSTARYAKKRAFDPRSIRVTVFDPQPPGEGGASAAAAGLLHPFTPRAKKKAWKSLRSVHAALSLIHVAEKHAPHTKIVHFPGLLRLALTDKMEVDFRQAAHRFPKEIEFLTPEHLRVRYPNAPEGVSAVFIKDAAVVDTTAYLKSLWQVCKESGRVQWQRKEIPSVASLLDDQAGDKALSARFDTVVLCAGASIKALTELRDVPLTLCRGQNLHLETSHPSIAPSIPLISGKYVIPDYFREALHSPQNPSGSSSLHRMIAGATFEYKGEDESESTFLKELAKKDTERAVAELEEPLHKLVPTVYKDWKVTGTTSGTRALPPRSMDGSIPIACKVHGTSEDVSCWIFTGLGSRGLLHHAYLGRMLAHAVVAGNDKLIPIDARRFEVSLRRKDLPKEEIATMGKSDTRSPPSQAGLCELAERSGLHPTTT